MSTALPFASVGELVHSASETAAFGFEVARISIGGAWAIEVPEADELARRVANVLAQAAEDTVIVRFPSELVEVATLKEPGGRFVQHAGTLLYWEDRRLDSAPLSTGSEAIVVQAGSEPPSGFVSSALSVLMDSFNGYINHYTYNMRIPPTVVRDGYVDWAHRTIAGTQGAAVLIRDGDEEIAAATLRFHTGGNSTVVEVELASVVSSRQGTGKYQELWSAIRKTAREAGAERLIISTQASNIRVQRAWARLGLEPLMSFDTLHATSSGIWREE